MKELICKYSFVWFKKDFKNILIKKFKIFFKVLLLVYNNKGNKIVSK